MFVISVRIAFIVVKNKKEKYMFILMFGTPTLTISSLLLLSEEDTLCCMNTKSISTHAYFVKYFKAKKEFQYLMYPRRGAIFCDGYHNLLQSFAVFCNILQSVAMHHGYVSLVDIVWTMNPKSLHHFFGKI